MKNNGYVPAYTNIKDYTSTLKYDAVFLQEIDSIVIRKSLFNLDDAYKNYLIKQEDILSLRVNIIKIVIILQLYIITIKIKNIVI